MIYFLTEGPEFNTLKVGYSKHPEKRIHQHQLAFPRPLKVIGIIEGDIKVENVIHKLLAHASIPNLPNREWYYYDQCIDNVNKIISGELDVTTLRTSYSEANKIYCRNAYRLKKGIPLDKDVIPKNGVYVYPKFHYKEEPFKSNRELKQVYLNRGYIIPNCVIMRTLPEYLDNYFEIFELLKNLPLQGSYWTIYRILNKFKYTHLFKKNRKAFMKDFFTFEFDGYDYSKVVFKYNVIT